MPIRSRGADTAVRMRQRRAEDGYRQSAQQVPNPRRRRTTPWSCPSPVAPRSVQRATRSA